MPPRGERPVDGSPPTKPIYSRPDRTSRAVGEFSRPEGQGPPGGQCEGGATPLPIPRGGWAPAPRGGGGQRGEPPPTSHTYSRPDGSSRGGGGGGPGRAASYLTYARVRNVRAFLSPCRRAARPLPLSFAPYVRARGRKVRGPLPGAPCGLEPLTIRLTVIQGSRREGTPLPAPAGPTPRRGAPLGAARPLGGQTHTLPLTTRPDESTWVSSEGNPPPGPLLPIAALFPVVAPRARRSSPLGARRSPPLGQCDTGSDAICSRPLTVRQDESRREAWPGNPPPRSFTSPHTQWFGRTRSAQRAGLHPSPTGGCPCAPSD